MTQERASNLLIIKRSSIAHYVPGSTLCGSEYSRTPRVLGLTPMEAHISRFNVVCVFCSGDIVNLEDLLGQSSQMLIR